MPSCGLASLISRSKEETSRVSKVKSLKEQRTAQHSQRWHFEANRQPDQRPQIHCSGTAATWGSDKIFYGKGNATGRLYLLALVCHRAIFDRGVEGIYHFQCESYYKALLHAPLERCLCFEVQDVIVIVTMVAGCLIILCHIDCAVSINLNGPMVAFITLWLLETSEFECQGQGGLPGLAISTYS